MNDDARFIDVNLTGVLSVLCTPFLADGAIDEASLVRLVDHQLAWGVDGVVAFGLAGELYKLSDDERRRILSAVVKRVHGAVPVIAGCDHSGTEAAVARAQEAVELGADALMAYPPTFVKPDGAGIKEYYEAMAVATDVPIIIQDAPAWTGVPLPVELLASIAKLSPRLRWVKVEAPPAAAKIRALRSAGFHVLGGCGALHLAEDLRAGIEGVMPGCALPGLYRDVWRAYEQMDEERFFRCYTQALPLLVFQMSSLDVISSPRLRRPGAELDSEQHVWLDMLVERTGLGEFVAQAPVRGPESEPQQRPE